MSEQTAFKSRIKISWVLWTLLGFVLFAVIGVYSSHMTWIYPDYDQQRVAERSATLAKLRETENKTLTTVDWVDQDKKIVHIPITEAMVKELDALKGKPVAMGGPLPGTTPAPSINTNAAPAAPAPATPAKPSPTPTPTPKT